MGRKHGVQFTDPAIKKKTESADGLLVAFVEAASDPRFRFALLSLEARFAEHVVLMYLADSYSSCVMLEAIFVSSHSPCTKGSHCYRTLS